MLSCINGNNVLPTILYMRKKTFRNGLVPFLSCLVLLTGCHRGKPGPAPFSTAERSSTELGGCDAVRGGAGATFRFLVPAGQDAASEQIRAILEKSRLEALSSVTDSSDLAGLPPGRTLRDIFGLFSGSYERFRKGFPETALCWTLEQTGDTVMTTPKLVVYREDLFTFTGGAHPNTWVRFHLIDSRTGTLLSGETLIKDRQRLLEKTETAFRRLEGIEAEADLEEKGYFLQDHKFFLPQAIAFNRQGIVLFYNPYEIAPYVRGPVSIEIPYAELSGIVDMDRIF